MTRKEAREFLIKRCNPLRETGTKWYDAIECAIKALEEVEHKKPQITQMRLIDADALQAKLYHEAFETDTDMQQWDSGCWIRYKLFEKAIEEAPTIEVLNIPEEAYGSSLRREKENDI